MFPEYTVQKGDTLSKIAKVFYGDMSYYKQLARFNEIENPDLIEIGQILKIPSGFYSITQAVTENGVAVHTVKRQASAEKEPEPLDGLMVFCPLYVGTGRPAFMYIPPDDAGEFVAQMDALDMDRRDFAAAYTKAREIRDPKERTKALEEVEKRFKDQYVRSLKPGEAKPDFQELVILNKWKPQKLAERYRYIKTDTIDEKKWVTESAAEFEKRIRKESRDSLDDKKKLSDYVTAKVKANLWKMKNPPEGQIFPEWRFSSSKDAWKDHKNIAASYDAAFLRYAANAEAGAEIDLREGIVQVNACGSASFSLFEGKADIACSLPDKDGFDIFAAIKECISQELFKRNRECFIKVIIKGEVYGFVGAQAAINVPKIDLNLKGQDASVETFRDGAVEKQKVVADVSASAFAGASGTLSATFEGAWRNVYQKNVWATLAREGGALSGRAGIGGEAGVKFEFKGGKIRFSARAALVIGLGGKAELIYELDLNEGCTLMAHFIESVAYHNVFDIAPDCFEAYYKFHLYVLTQSRTMLQELARGSIRKITDWWNEDAQVDKKTTLVELDDTKLRQAPPEALGRIIQLIMKSRQDTDYERILRILEQTRHDLPEENNNHELEWILRFTTKERTHDVKSDPDTYLISGARKIYDYFEHPESFLKKGQIERLDAIIGKYI